MIAVLASLALCANVRAQYAYELLLSADRTTLSVDHPTAVFTVFAAMNGPVSDPANFGPGGFPMGFVGANVDARHAHFSAAGDNDAVAPFTEGLSETVRNIPGDRDGIAIIWIDVLRRPEAGAAPPATGPAPHGVNTLVPVYTFELTITNFEPRAINVLTAAGGARITGWSHDAGSGNWVPALSDLVNFSNHQITINVESAPFVSSHPANTDVKVGQPALFTAAAQGAPSLSYQWRKDGTPLTDGGRISGATSPSLLILDTEPGDLASYDVVVTNSLGSATSDPGVLSFVKWTPPTVLIGNPGNPPDTAVMGDGSTAYGSVDYEFEIGQYEVTSFEYAQFLNAVASVEDTYSLYEEWSGILRTSHGGGFAYTPMPAREFMPIVNVSFHDAARYCNWLHNGRPVGPQNATTTESGVYTMIAQDAIAPGSIDGRARNEGWRWAIADEEEWYKAAFGNPSNTYTIYATQSDIEPVRSLPPGPVNSANFEYAVWDMTPVGSYTLSPSAWGTFDQNGNVSELLEGRMDRWGFYVKVRDASYSGSGSAMRSDQHFGGGDGSGGNPEIGFRIVRNVVGGKTGGCCLPTPGDCVDDVTSADCVKLGGVYAGDGSACSSLPCSIPRGACCLSDGSCLALVTAPECANADGLYQGDGVTCGTAACNPIGPVMYIDADAAPGGDGSSWALAFRNPQDAIEVHERYPGMVEELWIAAGTYKPDRGTGARNATFRFHDLRVLGGFAGNETTSEKRDPVKNVTILSGDLLGNDAPGFVNNSENSYRVVSLSGVAGPPTLDGFTIVAGNANQPGIGITNGAGASVGGEPSLVTRCIFMNHSSQRDGGAVLCSSRSGVISQCIFADNRSDGFGSALQLQEGGVAEQCLIVDNLGWAASAVLGASFVDCTFQNNDAGVFVQNDGRPTFLRCTFSGHADRAIATSWRSNLTITECLFENNAGAVWGDRMAVTDCTFRDNSADWAGGAVLLKTTEGAAAHFVRTHFDGNSADEMGGAIASSGCPTTFEDCTFIDNTAVLNGGALSIISGPTLDLSGCEFQGGNAAPDGGAVAFSQSTLIAAGAFASGDSVFNAGNLNPGGPGVVSTFSADGGYASRNISQPGQFGGNLTIDIGGLTPGVDYDVLDCGAGSASMSGGVIHVNLINSFVPTVGQTFRVIDAASISGAFSFVSSPGLDPGLYFDVQYSPTGVDLVVASMDSLFSFADESTIEVTGLPTDSVLADIDADGDDDLLVIYPGQPNGFLAVYRSAGTIGGVWQGFLPPALYPVGTDPRDLAVGRFSTGASLDVAVANTEDHSVMVFFNSGDSAGTLTLATTISTTFACSVAAGNNSPADLFIGRRSTNEPVVRYVSNGVGGFTSTAGASRGGVPVSIVIYDANNDGFDDLLVLRDREANEISNLVVSIFNPATQTYLKPYPYALGRDARKVALGDVDSDGRADLVITNTRDASLTVMISDLTEPGFFAVQTPWAVGADVGPVVLAPFSTGAEPDVGIIADNLNGVPTVRLMRNDTPTGLAPVFSTGADIGFSGEPLLINTGDVNADSLPDLIVIRTGPRGGGALVSTRVNTMAPDCRADWNNSGAVNSQDFFDFLNCFFTAGCNKADFNGSGAVNSQDFFDFLNAFFTGC